MAKDATPDSGQQNHYDYLRIDRSASSTEILSAIEERNKYANEVELFRPWESSHIRDRLRQIRSDLLMGSETRDRYDRQVDVRRSNKSGALTRMDPSTNSRQEQEGAADRPEPELGHADTAMPTERRSRRHALSFGVTGVVLTALVSALVVLLLPKGSGSGAPSFRKAERTAVSDAKSWEQAVSHPSTEVKLSRWETEPLLSAHQRSLKQVRRSRAEGVYARDALSQVQPEYSTGLGPYTTVWLREVLRRRILSTGGTEINCIVHEQTRDRLARSSRHWKVAAGAVYMNNHTCTSTGGPVRYVRQATRQMRKLGYSPVWVPPVRAIYNSYGQLTAWVGQCKSRNRPFCERVFVFRDAKFLGAIPRRPMTTIQRVLVDANNVITIYYFGYFSSDRRCCPSGPPREIRYRATGSPPHLERAAPTT